MCRCQSSPACLTIRHGKHAAERQWFPPSCPFNHALLRLPRSMFVNQTTHTAAPPPPPPGSTNTNGSSNDAASASTASAPMRDPGLYRSGGFDPSALEEAVEVLYSLPKGMAAQPKLSQMRSEAAAAAEAQRARQKEVSDYIKQMDGILRAKRAEGERAYRKAASEADAAREQYRDQLARARDADSRQYEEMDRKRAAEEAEASLHREAEARQATMEYAAQLRQRTDMATVRAQQKYTWNFHRSNTLIALGSLQMP